MSLRCVCVILTTRGNYAKMKSTMLAIQSSRRLVLQLVVGGALLEKEYGSFKEIINNDGFTIDEELDYIEGNTTLEGVVKSAGKCTILFGKVLSKLKPQVVMIIADRYEALSLAHAAVCMNIHIAHLEGGEISGSIDERIRHAISKLSHIHFVSNELSAERLLKMGEKPETIFVVGTPSLDQIQEFNLNDLSLLVDSKKCYNITDVITDNRGYIVVSQHPVVTEYKETVGQYKDLALIVKKLSIPAVWILPNDDAGSSVVKNLLLRIFNSKHDSPFSILGGMNFHDYAILIFNSKCLVGNTSSGLREAAYLGVPVVNIGTRQRGRQRGLNVIDVDIDNGQLEKAISKQIKNGHYQTDLLYGSGDSGKKIAQVLESNLPVLDKILTY
jgi:UDP-hydrolysing UDP-N-acetyl-D-glucosamine 2-epimerase